MGTTDARWRGLLLAGIVSLLSLGWPGTAAASDVRPRCRIQEVYAAAPDRPDVQYVMVRLSFPERYVTEGVSLSVFDRDATSVDYFTFDRDFPAGARLTIMLIATPQAEEYFGIRADFTMPPALNPRGGKICCWYPGNNCMAWGNYWPPDFSVGTPARPSGIPLGYALRRRRRFGSSSETFRIADPRPTNSAGEVGYPPPPSGCGPSRPAPVASALPPGMVVLLLLRGRRRRRG